MSLWSLLTEYYLGGSPTVSFQNLTRIYGASTLPVSGHRPPKSCMLKNDSTLMYPITATQTSSLPREIRRVNPVTGQRCALPDARQTNITGQWPGSNNSVGDLLLLIFRVASIEEVKIQPILKPHVQTAILLILDLWSQCSKNQLQSSGSSSNSKIT